MTISLSDLTTPVTVTEAKTAIYDTLAAVGVNTTSWKPGSPVRTMIAAVAIMLSAMSTLTAEIAKSGFLSLAAGDWLTLVARHVYGVERIEATFATGVLTLTNTGGGVYALDPGDLVATNSATGKTYRNTATIALAALATLDIAIEAIEAGADSSAAPDTITALETTLLGVVVNNAAAVVGLDGETDPALRTRCLEKLGALSPMGPSDAYSYAARSAVRADGTSVGVTRVRVSRDGLGGVTVYVATASGGITGTASNPDTDLGAVDRAIQTDAAPLAVTALAETATPLAIPVTYSVWAYNTSGLTTAQIEDQIATALAAFMAAQPIGGNVIGLAAGAVFVDGIRRAIGALEQIFHVEVTAPAADVVLSVNEVPTLGTVVATAIVQSAPGDGF